MQRKQQKTFVNLRFCFVCGNVPLMPEEKPDLVEPIFRQQPGEDDEAYTLYLLYRDLPWDTRTLRLASAKAMDAPEEQVKEPHTKLCLLSAKWQWPVRVASYELYIQEHRSELQEKILLNLKSDIEHTCLKITDKVKRLANVASADDIRNPSPEMQRDIAVVQALIPKGGAGPFLLDTYRTMFGQKMQIGAMRKIPELEWKSDS